MSLRSTITPFARAHTWRSTIEVVGTLVGYGALLGLTWYGYTTELWWHYGLAVLITALFLVKIFTLQHDCGHGSLFASRLLNRWVGRALALLTTMPFAAWKIEHDIHHSHTVDIEKSKHGDVPLLTVAEYKQLPQWKQFGYRIFRHPLFFTFVTPFLYFFVKSRIPTLLQKPVVLSVMLTNVAVLIVYGTLAFVLGPVTVFFMIVPAAYLGGIIGVSLFYLQHDYPGVEWFESHDWEHEAASLKGCSLILLPQPLEWFTHAIGFHHIHHLHMGIPGYRLRDCYEDTPSLQAAQPLSLHDIMQAFKMKLWSHEKRALVTFAEVTELER